MVDSRLPPACHQKQVQQSCSFLFCLPHGTGLQELDFRLPCVNDHHYYFLFCFLFLLRNSLKINCDLSILDVRVHSAFGSPNLHHLKVIGSIVLLTNIHLTPLCKYLSWYVIIFTGHFTNIHFFSLFLQPALSQVDLTIPLRNWNKWFWKSLELQHICLPPFCRTFLTLYVLSISDKIIRQ